MEEIDLIQQLKIGNSTVYSKWIELHSGGIERLAIQYGCEREEAACVAEETFAEIYNNLENVIDEEQLVYSLYKVAITKIEPVEPTKLAHKKTFPFEEDEQLHEKIILLDKEWKMAFILSKFHGMDNAEISKIIEMPEPTVELVTSIAYKYLEEKVTQLEKRLDFLRKSYNRITLLFNIENVFQKRETLVHQKPFFSKKVLFSWMAGIIILLALITVSVMTGDEYRNTSAEKYVEQLKESFEDEIAQKFTEVGLPKEKLIDGEIFPMFFGEYAREEFEVMIKKLEKQIKDNEKINKKDIKLQYEEILSKLELPSEMMDHLFENPLTDNKTKSVEFISNYVDMFLSLQQSLFMTFYDHEQIFADARLDGEIDIEKFIEEKDSYPEKLQNALDGMVKQNIYPISIKDSMPFYPVHVNNEISKRIKNSLHEDVGGFIKLLELEPLYYLDSAYSIDIMVEYMIEMEKTLFAFENDTNAFNNLRDVYISLLHEIIKGSETSSIVDQNGKVKEKHQLVWKEITTLDENLPSTVIMRELVDQMEASGWMKSKIHHNLDEETLYNAFDHAKQGDLSSFIFNENKEHGEIVIATNDPEFVDDVEERYINFSERHRLDHLEDASPLVVMGIYYLANEREDPVTMWHLFNKEFIDISLEEYVKNWTKVEPLPEGAGMLSMSIRGSSTLNGMPFIPISYEKENRTDHLTRMVLYYEYPDVWMIESIPEEIRNP